MFIYVSTVQVSYSRAQDWVKELQKQEGPGIVIALAGNKADLSDFRAIETDVTTHCFFSHSTVILFA